MLRYFPSALVLLCLWVTGIYLFILPHRARRKRRLAAVAKAE